MTDLADIHEQLKAHELNDSLHFQKLDDHLANLEDKLLDPKDGVLVRIEAQVAYTNGKLRKITFALTLIAGVVIGLGFTEARAIIPFIL